MSNHNQPTDDDKLNACGCCQAQQPPPVIFNRPGLNALAYRIGTHSTFFQRMIARLGGTIIPEGESAGRRPLDDLTTRAKDDPSIALLDAAATVADVLTFYQERIANETYLRTATERRSVLEMARAIGYELNPGVAASTFLAFTLEDAPGAPKKSVVPIGTKIQNVPAQSKLPQTFETIEEITARAEWGALRPRLKQPQTLTSDATQLYLKGTATNLKRGDLVLLLIAGTALPKRVRKVETLSDKDLTIALIENTPSAIPEFTSPVLNAGSIDANVPLNESTIEQYIINRQWSERDLSQFLSINNWDTEELFDYLEKRGKTASVQEDPGVFVLRDRAGFFGHNAPFFDSLPIKSGNQTLDFGPDWDSFGWAIWQDTRDSSALHGYADVYLERVVPGIAPTSLVYFQKPDGAGQTFRVFAVIERSLTGFALTGKATGLVLQKLSGSLLALGDKDFTFMVRLTTAYVQSEQLQLDDLPIVDELKKGDKKLLLDRLAPGLRVGQPIALGGERADAPGVIANQTLMLESVTHIGGYTELTFEDGFEHSYRRETVTLNANVARATHGETVREALGSGNGAAAHQRFVLKRPPLTHVPAPTTSGAESTVRVRVNDVLWQEAPSLYPLDSRSQNYIVRIDDEGKAAVIFGDGERGARLPTGVENVVATYRTGLGPEGEVDAGSLTLLQTRPLGIKGVTNPLAASGAAAPQKLSDARANAPLTVLTLERIVSLKDYEDFTRSFTGIGKAQAVALWNGESRLVHITIASASGKVVDPKSSLYTSLLQAIDKFRDPAQQVRLDSYKPVAFNVDADVIIDARYDAATVLARVEAALRSGFAFARREFAQAVSAAEVITAIQKTEGVVAADLNKLSTGGDELNQILIAASAHEENNNIEPAELLLVNPIGIEVREVKQ